MRGRGTKVSRRAVLAGFGAGVADKAFAGNNLEITGTDDGGFIVYVDFHEAWRISGNDIKEAWGGAATVVATPRPSVSVSGLLLGKTAKLELSFLPSLTGWACHFDLQLQKLGSTQSEARFPFSESSEDAISVPVLATAWRQAIGLPPGTVISRPRLKIARQTLAPTLSGPFVFEDFGGFRAGGSLALLPATDKDSPLARLDFRPTDILKLADGWKVEANGMNAFFPAKNTNGLVLEGDGVIQIGGTQFAAGQDSSVQCFREGSHPWQWKVDWHLADHEQVIDTPHGRFNVVGAGGSDITAQGTSRVVQQYSASAQLRHAALRLPLGDKGQSYADLGRLDFDDASQSQIAFKLTRSAKPTEASWISLDPEDAEPVHIQLDSARLRVARQADLFQGFFRFSGLALSQTKNGLLLRKSPSAPANACLLKVELPPQHVREQSFARQLPNLPGSQLSADELQMLFDVTRRKKLQQKLLAQKGVDPNLSPFATKYLDKYVNYKGTIFPVPSASTSALEQIYVGPDGLITLLGRHLANELASELKLQAGVKIADVPLGLDPIIVGDILQRHQPPQPPPWTLVSAQSAFGELLSEAAKRSDDLSLLQNWYGKAYPTATGQFYVVDWLTNWPNEFPKGSGTQKALKDLFDVVSKATAPSSDGAQAILSSAYTDRSPQALPVSRQLSGTTRLVFDMTAKKGDSWPYSLDTLLAWSDLQLKVTQRATRFDIAAGTSQDGLIDALTKQQIPPSSTIEDRLTAVYAQAQMTPSEWDTSIELPAKLYLSPASDARLYPSRPPLSTRARVPIWQAQLRELPGRPYTLRAISSPDFNPAVFKPFSLRTPYDKTPPRNGDDFQSSLDGFDRHQLVGLSSIYGLAAIARQSDEGVEQTSQVSPPPGYMLTDLLDSDSKEQALYIPRALPFRKLNLSPMGASLDLDALFVPPASVRDSYRNNLYDAFSVERFHAEISFGRDAMVEVLYKGFLYPIGFRATLVKLTERFYLPWPDANPQWPVGLLRQRLFIQIPNPTKTFPAVNQPFQGRGWPAQSMTLDMDHTPDLINPVLYGDNRSDQPSWSEQSSGRLDHASRVGLVFWPRTTPGASGNIQFRMTIDDRLEPVSMPLIFVDNAAAHDATTLSMLRDYYNKEVASDLRQLQHGSVRRRYAPEEKPGDTTFETLTWLVAADARDNPSAKTVVRPADSVDSAYFLVDSAMESVDQPPVYPRLENGQIRHDSSARFTGNAQKPTTITYYDPYLSNGFLTGGSDRDLGKKAFLIVSGADADAPSLDMGGNGDRSGGIGRPNLPIRAIGRDGPIGGPSNVTSGQTLPNFGSNGFQFFSDKALVLGIVRLNALVDMALDTAVPPLLKDTLEFSCNLVRQIAYAARLELNKVRLCRFDSLPDLIKGAYGTLRSSLDDMDSSLAPLAPAIDGSDLRCQSLSAQLPVTGQDTDNSAACDPQAITQVLAKARNLIGELDKLAADPLAPLMQIVDKQISDATTALSNDILNSVEQPFANLVAGIQVDVVSDVLLPIGEALALVDTFQDLVAIKPAIASSFDDATKETFAQALPPTLAGLRDQWVKNARSKLEALRSGQSTPVDAAITALETALNSFGATQPPNVLNELYETAFTLRTDAKKLFDPTVLKKLLPKSLTDELQSWWGEIVAPKCVEVLNALKSVRTALVASAFDPTVCKVPGLCVDKTVLAGAANGLCLQLWQICQDAPSLSPASIKLAMAYSALATAATDLVNIESDASSKCSDPANLNQVRHDLTRNLQRLGAAKQQFVASLKAWAGDLGSAVQASLTQAAASRIGAATASALSVLTPSDADIADFVDNLTPVVGADTAAALMKQLKGAIDGFTAQEQAFYSAANLNDLRKAADGLKNNIDTLSTQATQAAENAITEATLRAALPPITMADTTVTDVLQQLDKGYAAVKQTRDNLRDGPNGLQNLQHQLEDLGVRITGTSLETILDVPPLNAQDGQNLRAVCVGVPNLTEGLDQEQAVIHCIAGLSPKEGINALMKLFKAWGDQPPALVRLITEFGQRAKKVMTLPPQVSFMDVTGFRQALSDLLQDAIPSKQHLAYAWDLKFNQGKIPIGSLADFILPDTLSLTANTEIDLLKIGQAPKFQVSGALGGFAVDIWQSSLTLYFHPFSFTAGSGSSPHFSADLKDVKIGVFLAFLTALEAYFQAQSGDPSGGAGGDGGVLPNGPYIVPRDDGPGIKAGYRLALGDVELGNLAIFGMNFDAHCEMPFDGTKGAVRVSLATPDAPFLITFAPYGGRGHFLLESGPDLSGALFDVGFQYGGAVAVAFGPLTGSAVVMIGFRVQKSGSSIAFSGFFIAAFEGHVACFGVAVCFSVTMWYRDSHMIGEAQLSFEFSCGPAKVKYQVGVSHNSGGQIGQSAWLEPRQGVPRVIPVAFGEFPAAVAIANIPALLEDWPRYQSRYDLKVRAAGRRQRK